MRFLTSRITVVVAFLLTAVGLIGMIGHASWYRWDMKITAPIAYEIGVENEWYEGVQRPLSEVTKASRLSFEKSLKRQGFSPSTEETAGSYAGFHRKSDGLYWYTFKVEDDVTVLKKKFSVASGLCAQTVGVLISGGDNPSVRYLNPGASCV